MSNYTQNVSYAPKDALTTGDPNKAILGSQIDAEFSEISTAIASKEDAANKGQPSGYAPLSAASLLLDSYLTTNIPRLDSTATISATWTFSVPQLFNAAIQVTTIEVGHVSDTTLSRISAGVIGVEGVALSFVGHGHAAADVTSGTFADARIAQSNVTQHQAALSLATSQISSGTFADARIAQSNVTQHQAALVINTDQNVTDYADDASVSYTLGSGDAESIRRFTSSSPITITLPNSIPAGWAVGDSMVIIRGGTGTLTFSSAGTIRSPGGSTINVQNGKACATLAASGTWELSGNV